MTVISREAVRDEVVAGLSADIVGDGRPVKAVYGYQIGTLEGESPVVLVLSGPIKRKIAGMGAKRYDNTITLEIQSLVYDGDTNQDLSEQEREDKLDEIEAAIATWCVNHQIGTNYRALRYTPNEPTEVQKIPYLDGNPYLLEVIKIEVEAPDLA
jgi:hypothetical protein